MYDTLLKKTVIIAERYAGILERFMQAEIEPPEDGLGCGSLMPTINGGIEVLNVAVQTLEKLDSMTKGGKRYSEKEFNADVAKAFFNAFANKESRRGDYK